VQEVTSHLASTTPAASQHGLPRSSHSSRSRDSAGSGPTVTAKLRGPWVRSEFIDIEKQIEAGRAKAKTRAKRPSPDTQPFAQSTSGSNTPHHQGATIYINDDESVAMAHPARRLILQSFSQGVSDHPQEERDAPSKRETITSRHFPNARINESTGVSRSHDANKELADSNRTNLRAFRRADGLVDYDPDSVDELAMDMTQNSIAPVKRQSSPSVTSQSANSGARRKPMTHKDSKGWSLLYARSHDFDSFQYSKPADDDYSVYLKPGQSPDTWRIVAFNNATEVFETKATMTPKDVVKVLADDDGRIRLEGPRRPDGNRSVFDLEFQDMREFREFRDTHAMSLSAPQKLTLWDERRMKTLFSKPLAKNNKVGTSPLLHNSPSLVDEQEAMTHRARDAPLWAQMSDCSQALNSTTSALSSQEPLSVPAPRGTSARAVRSTRASAPMQDIADEHIGKEVEKYSVLEGLGQPWVRPLTYGEGRQKATVYFDDLSRLDEEEFMNDSLIDFYMIYLFKQSGIPHDKVFFFNTYFFTRLTQKTGRGSINYEAVERWTSKVEIFDYDYVVVPINEDTHWYLAIICNIGKIPRKAIEEDFDGSIAELATDVDNASAQQVGPVAVETPAESKLVEGKNPVSSRASSITKAEGDINLFDEESKLDLINREDTGTDGDCGQAATGGSSVTQSPLNNVSHAASLMFDEQVVSKTVLSNLNASPEKKKLKRRSMVPKKDPTQPVIIILDSLSQTRSPTVRALKNWIAAEGKVRRGMEATIKEKGFYPKSNQIPTQSNYTDCGVYLLGYAEKFFQNPDEFKNKLLTGEMTATEDWPQLKPKEMRKNLRDIIFELAREQKLTEAPKKKKVKKSTQASKSLHARADAEATKSGNPPAQMVSDIMNSVEAKTTIAEMVSAGQEPVTLEETHPGKPSAPRLRSPFSPKSKVQTIEHPVPALKASDRVSDVAANLVSSEKAVIASPGPKHTPIRRTHPEVRIPLKMSPSQEPEIKRAGSETSQKGQPQQERTNIRSVSPLKRVRKLTDDDDYELPKPLKKKSTPDVVSSERKGASRLSPVLTRPREGHSDHPIEILDSQESKPTGTQSPRRILHGSPPQRKQSSKSPQKASQLSHEPSVQEISAFSMLRKNPRAVKDFVGAQLETRLAADSEAREKVMQARNCTSIEESELDIMEVDSQGADPMDTAEDTVVRETPEPGRRSPVVDVMWTTGHPLPL
jgi:sentrin-specific protease 7